MPTASISIDRLDGQNENYLENFNIFVCPYNNYFNYSNVELDSILTYKHVINGWLSMCIILVGIIANFITICALLHEYMRMSSTNLYLTALSFSNLVSLLCLFFMTALRFVLVHPYRLLYCKHWYENLINKYIPYLTPINNMFQLSGIYLIIAVSIDRLILIRNRSMPTECSRKKRRQATWFIIGLIFVFCFLFTCPNWFLYKTTVVEMKLNKTELLRSIRNQESTVKTNNLYSSVEQINQTNHSSQEDTAYFIKHFRTEYTKFGSNNIVKKVISIFMYIPFVFFIPISVLLIVNFLIIFELFKISKR